MSERIEQVIVVTDKGSQTFAKVGSAAQKMGTQVDQAATQSTKSMTKMSGAGAAVGAAFATMGAGLAIASRANAEAEASQARLETAIENTGHSLFEYEDALNAAGEAAVQLGFDDEDAADSIALMTSATGDAERAIQNLSLAEDIARARKISLEQATKIVIAAEQERFGALARMGIAIDENATKEQALDALRAKFAGSAEAYAETEAGAMDRRKVQLGNYVEAVGAALGPTQQLFIMLPGLSTAFTGVGAAVGALAPNLTKAAAGAALLNVALGPVGIAALAVTAGLAIFGYTKYLRDSGDAASVASGETEKLNELLKQQIQIGSKLAPTTQDVAFAVDFITTKARDYNGEMAALNDTIARNEQWLETNGALVGEQSAQYQNAKRAIAEARAEIRELIATRGGQFITEKRLLDMQKAANEILADTGPAARKAQDELKSLTDQVNAGTISWPRYAQEVVRLARNLQDQNIAAIEAGESAGATAEEVDKLGQSNNAAAAEARAYADAMLAQNDVLVAQGDAFRAATVRAAEFNAEQARGALAETLVAPAIDPSNIIAATEVLKRQEGAYYGVRDGITSASDAQAIFAQTQQDIIASQEPYNQQLSTYNTQLGNINDAVELLNQRQAEGETLTADQVDFLNRAGAAQERLQGGTEDATLALGEQALQYAENMRIGDEMNQKLGEQVSSTDLLTQTMNDLIAALQGIPGYVKTNIEADSSQAEAAARNVTNLLNALDGRVIHTGIVIGVTSPGSGVTDMLQYGGRVVARPPQVPHAQYGTVVMNEAGGEIVRLPNGSMVYPHHASEAMLQNQRGGGGQIVVQRMYVQANRTRDLADSMRSASYAEQRLR